MAAAGTSPALNLREKLAELAGLKQRVSPDLVRCDFTNLVTNGTFDTSVVGWTANAATLSIASSKLRITNTTTGFGLAYRSLNDFIENGRSYQISLFETGFTADGKFGIGTSATGEELGATTLGSVDQTLNFTAQASTFVDVVISNSGISTYAEFDQFSLYEADPSDDAPWLRLPYGYKVGQRGMIVRDGVVLHPSDYTEITDSGQTFIKPIVAPGASTEFSIWAGA